MAKYKHFVVQKFYEGLVGEARGVFEMTRVDVDAWLKSALNPLNLQIKEHEAVLSKRLENFKKIRDNIGSVEGRIKQLDSQRVVLEQQREVLARIQASLDGEDTMPAMQPAPAAVERMPATAPV